jgi:hypothetical protein
VIDIRIEELIKYINVSNGLLIIVREEVGVISNYDQIEQARFEIFEFKNYLIDLVESVASVFNKVSKY